MPSDQFAAYFFLLKQRFLPFQVEKKKIEGQQTNAFLARFGVHFFWAIFDYGIGVNLPYLANAMFLNFS